MDCVLAILFGDLFNRTEADLRRLTFSFLLKLRHSIFTFFLSVKSKLIFIGLTKASCQHEQIHIPIDNHSQLNIVQIIPIITLTILTGTQPLESPSRTDVL
jgi:hypothetical protein